ncbi:hypothetical protein MNBD_ALPHA01-2463, partial [hydrothermal vent metagenome]
MKKLLLALTLTLALSGTAVADNASETFRKII